jgi:hypothetical protein
MQPTVTRTLSTVRLCVPPRLRRTGPSVVVLRSNVVVSNGLLVRVALNQKCCFNVPLLGHVPTFQPESSPLQGPCIGDRDDGDRDVNAGVEHKWESSRTGDRLAASLSHRPDGSKSCICVGRHLCVRPSTLNDGDAGGDDHQYDWRFRGGVTGHHLLDRRTPVQSLHLTCLRRRPLPPHWCRPMGSSGGWQPPSTTSLPQCRREQQFAFGPENAQKPRRGVGLAVQRDHWSTCQGRRDMPSGESCNKAFNVERWDRLTLSTPSATQEFLLKSC